MPEINHNTTPREKRDFFIVGAIFLCALFLRLVYLTQYKDSPFYTAPIIDALSHYHFAGRMAAGDWLIKGVVTPRVPLYVYFLAVLFKIFGTGYTAARVVQIVLGAFNCVLTFFIGKKVFNRTVGACAGLICAAYGVLIHFDAEFLSVGLTIFLDQIFILFLLRAIERPRIWKWLAAGVLFGISLQTSPNIILFLPLLFIWLYVFMPRRAPAAAVNPPPVADAAITGPDGAALNVPEPSCLRRHRPAVTAIICVGISALLTVLPLSLRNYFFGGDFVLLSSTVGINLYIGNNEAADGKTASPPSRDFSYSGWEDNVWVSSTKVAERLSGRKLSPGEVSDFWLVKTARFVFTRPGQFIELLLRKFYYLFNAFEIPENQSIYFFRVWSSLLYLLVFSGRYLSFPFGIIGPLALLGIAVCFRKEKGVILLVLFIAAHLWLMLIFFVVSRYRAPLIPYFVIFAAAGFSWLAGAFKERRYKTFLVSFLAFGVIFLFCNSRLFGVTADSRANWFFKLGTAFDYKGQKEKALKSYLEALKIDPANLDAEYNIGVLYLERGDREEASRHFQKVISGDPHDSASYNNIGITLAEQGHPRDAIEYYKKALEIDSEDVLSMVNLASAYIVLDDLKNAEDLLRRAESVDSAFAPLYNCRGVLNEKKGNDAEAEKAYLRAVAMRSDYFEAYYNLAALYERLGRREEMIAARANVSALLLLERKQGGNRP